VEPGASDDDVRLAVNTLAVVDADDDTVDDDGDVEKDEDNTEVGRNCIQTVRTVADRNWTPCRVSVLDWVQEAVLVEAAAAVADEAAAPTVRESAAPGSVTAVAVACAELVSSQFVVVLVDAAT